MILKKTIKRVLIFVGVLFLIFPFLLVYLRYQNYLVPEFRNFVSDCKSIKPGFLEVNVRDIMKNYEDLNSIDPKGNRDSLKLAYRISSKYSADLCLIRLSKSRKVIKSEFSPD